MNYSKRVLAYIFCFLLAACGGEFGVQERDNQYLSPEQLAALTIDDVLVNPPQKTAVLLIDLSASIPSELRAKVSEDATTLLEQGWAVIVTEIGTNSGSSTFESVRLESSTQWECNVPEVKSEGFQGSRGSAQGEMAKYERVKPHVDQLATDCGTLAAERNMTLEDRLAVLKLFMDGLRINQSYTDITGALQSARAQLEGSTSSTIVIYSDMNEDLPSGSSQDRTVDLQGVTVTVYQYLLPVSRGQVERESQFKEEWTAKLKDWGAADGGWNALILKGVQPVQSPPVRQATQPRAKAPSKATKSGSWEDADW